MKKNTAAFVCGLIGAIFGLLGGILCSACTGLLAAIEEGANAVSGASGNTTLPYLIVFIVLGIGGSACRRYSGARLQKSGFPSLPCRTSPSGRNPRMRFRRLRRCGTVRRYRNHCCGSSSYCCDGFLEKKAAYGIRNGGQNRTFRSNNVIPLHHSYGFGRNRLFSFVYAAYL